MQQKQLFEYAIIRFVPKVEREEFINIGVILCCQGLQFLQMKFTLDKNKITALIADADIKEIEENLNAFKQICEGNTLSAPIGLLPLAERFRWLTATRSTIVQTSQVHPGFCNDANETLERLYKQMVL
ncbi:MAG: DUF3037 domain-containing protein [Fimbriimonadaceae bacterium]|nr:DUF3037 domain-containing protein [Chitinophagales bacterium]